MKNIFISIVLVLSIGLQSCSLEETPYSISAETLAQDPDGAEQLVTGIYSAFWSTYMMKKTYQEWVDMDHDLTAAPSWVVSGAGQGNVTTHWGYNNSSDLFNVFYLMISRCNSAKIALEDADLTNTTIAQRYGEVLFLRAWAYFHLVRMYGPVPLRLEAIPSDSAPRASISEVYAVIEDDLLTAIDNLSYPSEGPVGDWGHADKTAARILLARVYVTMASGKLAGDGVQMFTDICNQSEQATQNNTVVPATPNVWTEFTTKPVMGSQMEDGYAVFDADELYTKAIEQCDEVISRRGIDFDLMTEWKDIWGSTNYRNKEFVWGVASYEDDDYRTDGGPYYYTAAAYGGTSWVAMSHGAWQMYDYVIGSEQNDARAVDGVFHYWKDYASKDAGKQWYRFPLYDTAYDTAPDGLKPDTSDTYVMDKDDSSSGGYFPIAFSTKHYMGDDISNPTVSYVSMSTSNTYDIILIRFAEAYLLRAEARNEIGNASGALDDLNVIRDRSNATLYNTSDKVALRSYIFQERGIEFMQEFNRRFDLIRWGMYLNVMNATESILTSSHAIISLVREERCVLTAVPTAEITANAEFGSNNPGW